MHASEARRIPPANGTRSTSASTSASTSGASTSASRDHDHRHATVRTLHSLRSSIERRPSRRRLARRGAAPHAAAMQPPPDARQAKESPSTIEGSFIRHAAAICSWHARLACRLIACLARILMPRAMRVAPLGMAHARMGARRPVPFVGVWSDIVIKRREKNKIKKKIYYIYKQLSTFGGANQGPIRKDVPSQPTRPVGLRAFPPFFSFFFFYVASSPLLFLLPGAFEPRCPPGDSARCCPRAAAERDDAAASASRSWLLIFFLVRPLRDPRLDDFFLEVQHGSTTRRCSSGPARDSVGAPAHLLTLQPGRQGLPGLEARPAGHLHRHHRHFRRTFAP